MYRFSASGADGGAQFLYIVCKGRDMPATGFSLEEIALRFSEGWTGEQNKRTERPVTGPGLQPRRRGSEGFVPGT